ncbi:MAG: TatD DNase family protein [Psychromonas sp.]|jgi:TatD DNase family protein|uniref:TatD family hydrolase n=1 Tax=Psychromonas sp. TaxID=1884585 RepID=UPI0039E66CC1
MFIDSHCHLDFPCFTVQLDALLSQLQEKQIIKVIIPATQRSGWHAIQALCAEHAPCYYALGIHPHFIDSLQEDDLLCLQQLLNHSDKKQVAVGEIGLDKYASADMELQESIFIKQLQLAQRFNLPIILHVVKKQSRVLEILKKQHFTLGGVYHAFSGSYEVAMEFIKLGFKIGIGGVITYPNSTKTKQTIRRLPIESLLLETDAPDMPLYLQQDGFNSPLNIPIIFESLCLLRKESKSCLAAQIIKNTETIFLKE